MSVAKLANHDKNTSVKCKESKASATHPQQICVQRIDHDNMLASLSCE